MEEITGRSGKPARATDPLPKVPQDGGSGGKTGEYEVGYGRPPLHSRFGKGNNFGKGRRKGSKNFGTIVNEALGAKVPAKVNGRTRKMTKAELAMHQLANKASAGDLKAIDKAITLQERYGPRDEGEEPSAEEQKVDLETLREYLAFRGMVEGRGEWEDQGG